MTVCTDCVVGKLYNDNKLIIPIIFWFSKFGHPETKNDNCN